MYLRPSQLIITLVFLLCSHLSFAGIVQQHTLKAKALKENLIGVDPERRVHIYLPDGYMKGRRTYPVIYYVTSFEQKIDDKVIDALDQAIARGELPPSLFVSADFRLEQGLNFFGNNKVVGRWLDFIHKDLRSFVESEYRVKRGAEHRAISGHFLGGYAAIKLAMMHPDTYGSVYALHPVATESGDRSFLFMPDWNEIHEAKDISQFKAPYSVPFVSMAQAHLPNTKKPPFYADFIVEKEDGQLKPNVANIRKLKQTFHLGDLTPKYAENLHKLRGIGFDWGRKDQNFGHVIGARRYSVLLENFGVKHMAEEHLGNGWDYNFAPDGKIRSRMLPFLGKHLAP